jgi:hypothetical protein
MLYILIHLFVICVVGWLIWWAMSYFSLPDPAGRIARFLVIAILVIALIFEVGIPLIQAMAGGVGGGPHTRLW